MDLTKLTAPERALWEAFPRGEPVDLTKAWGVWARTVRAEVIAALLLGGMPPDPGRIAAVRLDGARVTGRLDLGHAAISSPIRLRHCEFDAPVDLSGGKTRDLDFEGSRLAGLLAPVAEIDGNLSLIGSECSGPVVLTGAHITGALHLQGSHLDSTGAVALRGNRLVIDDDLLAQHATVDGEFRLAAAQIGGILGLDGATLRNPGGRALNAFSLAIGARFLARKPFHASGEIGLSDASVGRDVNFNGATLENPTGDALVARGLRAGTFVALGGGFTAEGAVRLSRARIEGALFLDGTRLASPDGEAIRCRNAQAATLVVGPGFAAEGIVDFRYSRFTVIQDDESCWPARMRVSGLVYEALDPPLGASRRVAWLRRDIDEYLPQNYETLAAMYRSRGDDASARIVLLARERHRREQLPWAARAWSWLQEVTVGYGYRPLRAAAWLVAFLAMGTLVFGLHHPPAFSANVAVPPFNPFVYTLDLLVPLVNFGMRGAYDPQGPQRWLAYLLIAVGWIFVTTIAAGIARVLRRE